MKETKWTKEVSVPRHEGQDAADLDSLFCTIGTIRLATNLHCIL